MVREYYRLLHKSLWIRAARGTDSVAGKWAPLSRWTREKKLKLADEGKLGTYKLLRDWYKGVTHEDLSPSERVYLKGKLTKGLLSPEQADLFDKEFKQAFTDELGKLDGDSKTAKKLALAKAWERIRKTELKARAGVITLVESQFEEDRQFATLINYRTGRLFAAAFPGVVSNNRYYPSSKDQIVKYTTKKIIVSFDAVEYADEVDQVRKLFPTNTDAWVEQAHNNIIKEVEQLYVSMRSDYDNRKAVAREEIRRRRTFFNKPKRDIHSARRKTKSNKRTTKLNHPPF
jgi:hypothetical protein